MVVLLVGLLRRHQRRCRLLQAPPRGPDRARRTALGHVLVGQWLNSTSSATLRRRRRSRPGLLAVPSEVAEAVGA
jgi:hypothetical protein